MFKKLIKNIDLKRFIAFLIMEIFILSVIPLNLMADESNQNNTKGIFLSYSIDKKNDTLTLKWTKSKNNNDKYFVFKKSNIEAKYRLVTGKDGLTETEYVMSLKENMNSYFIVCLSDSLPELPDDVVIFSLEKIEEKEDLFARLKNSKKIMSNEVCIRLDDNYVKTAEDTFKTEKIINDLKNNKQVVKVIDKKNKEYNENLKKEIEVVLNNDSDKNGINDENNEKLEGLYWIDNSKSNKIEYKGVVLEIPAYSSPNGSYIYIKTLKHDEFVEAPKDSPNLTDNNIAGYDISLNGDARNKFTNDIKISFKYDKKRIPKDANGNNVFAYYYDEDLNKWKPLKRKSLENGYICSVTDHFCQFFVGMMNVPTEPPQSKGINTNPINIQKVDPMAGINGLPEVAPNNEGSANVSYPIKLPEGINNMTPKVSISYSSEGKEGSCGYGWNLSTSAIVLNTKDGIPKYDGSDELLLDGMKLVKTGSSTYRFKNEGAFSKVEKSGDYFIVHQTNGSKLYYGESDLSRLYNPNNNTKIFAWYLTRVVDKFGNEIKYQYEEAVEDTKRVNIYLSKILYGYNDVYTVSFEWADRNDIRTNYRAGFQILNNEILDKITVKYKNIILMTNDLIHETDGYNKSVLKSIQEVVDGQIINEQEYEYDKGVIENISYDNPIEMLDNYAWGHINDKFSINQNDQLTYRALIDMNGDGLSDRVSCVYNGDYGLYVGLNNGNGFNAPTEWLDNNAWGHVNDKFPINQDNEFTYRTLIDMNGDGLPDRVSCMYNSDYGLYVGLNNGNGFDSPIEWLDNYAWGHVNDKFPINQDDQLTYRTLIDMNGDGLPDRVSNMYNSDYGLYVGLNNGNGFDSPIEWLDNNAWGHANDRFPINQDNEFTYRTLIDMNGDGLPDRVSCMYNGDYGLYVGLNNGNGFDSPTEWLDNNAWGHANDRFPINKDNQLTYRTLIDMNGDGLTDRVSNMYNGDYGLYVGLNNGNRFDTPIEWLDNNAWGHANDRFPINQDNEVTYRTLMDLNGDGLSDRVSCVYNGDLGLYYSKNNSPQYKLTKITNAKTGTYTKLAYERNHVRNHKSFFALSSVTTGNDDLSVTTTIKYENGVVDRLEREFRGFEKVTTEMEDTDKNVIHKSEVTYRINDITGYDENNNPIYDQYINGQQDAVVSSIVKNGVETILSKQKSIYNKVSVLTGYDDVKYVYANEKRVWIYDDNGTFLGVDEENGDILETINHTFDYNNGIITKTNKLECIDPYHTNDDVKTITNIALNITNWFNLPYKIEKTDIADARISLKTIYYDGLTEGSVDTGVMSSEKEWNNFGYDAVTENQYDSYGNKIYIKNPDGLITNIQVNYIAGDVIYKEVVKALPSGLTEINKYDIYGRKKEITDIFGDTMINEYDEYGRLITVSENINGVQKNTKEFSYSMDGDLFKVECRFLDNIATDKYFVVQYYKDGLGREKQFKKEAVVNGTKLWIVSEKSEYDSMGRVVRIGSLSTTSFSNNGFVDNGLINPVINIEYDDLGREISRTLFNDSVLSKGIQKYIDNNRILQEETSITYDSADNILKKEVIYKDMSGNVVRISKMKDNGTYVNVDYEYDLHGKSWVYENPDTADENIGIKLNDSLGNLVWMKSADAGKFEYIYNEKGLIVKVKDYGKNETDYKETNYSYDSQNRLILIDYDGTDCDVVYEYHGIDGGAPKYGKSSIKKITKGNYYSVEYDFDQFGLEEIKTIESNVYTSRYEYDVQGRIKQVTYPDGEVVNYSYDDGGYLERIEGNQVYIDSIKYDQYGQRTYVKYGNGSEMTYNYDVDTRLLDQYIVKDKNNNELLKYNYDFTDDGNVTAITDNAGSIIKSVQNYQYDLLGRLINSDGDYMNGQKSYNRSYEYDDEDKIIRRNFEDGSEYLYSYMPDSHAISEINILNSSNGITKYEYGYDEYGKMIADKTFAGVSIIEQNIYIYDEANRLKKIDNGITELSFIYDNKGSRIKKVYQDEVSNIKETVYVNDYYTISDSSINKHISDGKSIISTKIADDPDNILYYHTNHVGSTALLTDKDGEKFQEYKYYPYGELWVEDETVNDEDITKLYTGHEYDEESGLYYMKERYYNPKTGVFMRPDPALSGLNHYAYANCNPMLYNDPTGKDAVKCYQSWNAFSGGHTAIAIEDGKGGYYLYSTGASHDTYFLGKGSSRAHFKSKSELKEVLKEKYHYDYFETVSSSNEEDLKMIEAAEEYYKEKTWNLFSTNCNEFTDYVLSSVGKDTIGYGWYPNSSSEKIGAINQLKWTFVGVGGMVGITGTMIFGSIETGLVKSERNMAINAALVTVKIACSIIAPGLDVLASNIFKVIGYAGSGDQMKKNGKKIICTELYRQGLMDEITYKADQEFGRYLADNKPYVMKGYHFLAKPVVRLMHKSKLVTKIVYVIAMPWAKEMSYKMGYREKGDFVGKIIMGIGLVLCGFTGMIIEGKININLYIYVLLHLLLLMIITYLENSKKKKFCIS